MAVLRWGSASDPGQLRAQNEDHAHAGDGLFVVADGMGGHLAGEVASEMAVSRLDTRLPSDAESTLDDLVSAIGEANTEIYNGSVTNPDQAGMGTTVTAIAVVADPLDGEALAIANVGDSRAYVLRHGRLRQVTTDHNFVQELVNEGAITREEARTHPRRNIVTRALGIEPYVRVDSWTMPIIRGDRFVLCSDGLVDEVTDEVIAEILQRHVEDPDAAAQALVDAANEAGGRDNITVVVVDVLEGDDPPDPTEEFDVIPLWSEGDDERTGEVQVIADPLPDDEHATSLVTPDGTEAIESDPAGGSERPAAAALLAEAVAAADADTATAPAPPTDPSPTTPEAPRRRRASRFGRFVLAVGVAAVLILGFAVFAAWARSGYFVAFDDDGQVVIYQGREDGVLWFEPTEEAVGRYTRDQLDDDSIALVEDRVHFESQASAERFVASRLTPTTTTSTTTTTTTTIPPTTTTVVTTTTGP